MKKLFILIVYLMAANAYAQKSSEAAYSDSSISDDSKGTPDSMPLSLTLTIEKPSVLLVD